MAWGELDRSGVMAGRSISRRKLRISRIADVETSLSRRCLRNFLQGRPVMVYFSGGQALPPVYGIHLPVEFMFDNQRLGVWQVAGADGKVFTIWHRIRSREQSSLNWGFRNCCLEEDDSNIYIGFLLRLIAGWTFFFVRR